MPSDKQRWCTACVARGEHIAAAFVARGASGLEWFECSDHGELDNFAEDRRVSLEPIADWFRRHDLPPPPWG